MLFASRETCLLRFAFLALALAGGPGCASNASPAEPSACVSGLDPACAPLYSPTFHDVFTRTLQGSCVAGGGSCHGPDGHQAGLVFDDEDASYALLLGETDGRARVIAGDAACSLLVERIESGDASSVMPRGGRLADGERCAIEQWIHNGAAR